MNLYEGLYIFPDTLKDEELEGAITRAGDEVRALGGSVESVTRLGRRTFSRQLGKQESGFYAVMMIKLDGDKIEALRKRYRLIGEVFRVQITRKNDGGDAGGAAEA